MRFVWWTLVYWGIMNLDMVTIYGFPYLNGRLERMGDGGMLLSDLISWFLYFFLYNKFIKGEHND